MQWVFKNNVTRNSNFKIETFFCMLQNSVLLWKWKKSNKCLPKAMSPFSQLRNFNILKRVRGQGYPLSQQKSLNKGIYMWIINF